MKKLIDSINKLSMSELEDIIVGDIIPFFRDDELNSLRIASRYVKLIKMPEIYSVFEFGSDNFEELRQIDRNKLFILAYEQVKYDKKA